MIAPTPKAAPDATTTSQSDGRKPKLPHEHDESAETENGVRQESIEQAHDDVRRGLPDTDRGPAMDEAYRKQKSGG